MMKKAIALLMAVLFVCMAFTGCGQKKQTNSNDTSIDDVENQEEFENDSYKNLENGSTIAFGEYPQSKVEDDVVIAELDNLLDENAWANIPHYTVARVNEKLVYGESSNWWYQDVELKGCKYRALFMGNKYYAGAEYSPNWSHRVGDAYTDGPSNEPKWFKFDPIMWKILDKENGIVVCNSIIDAQEYNHNIKLSFGALGESFSMSKDADEYYCADESLKTYTGDFANSSLREWLNDTFYNTAFSTKNKKAIISTTSKYDKIDQTKYQATDTTDNVYILSDADLRNHEKYGFNPSTRSDAEDKSRGFNMTEYAAAVCSGYTDMASYWTRTSDVRDTYIVGSNGGFYNCEPFVIKGALPALTLNLKKAVK